MMEALTRLPLKLPGHNLRVVLSGIAPKRIDPFPHLRFLPLGLALEHDMLGSAAADVGGLPPDS